ncbi:MAG: hypothetical protein PHS86_08830 [Syntrophaceae bacterium]|nr:hypothetical protein [Syntrophaceae bacterium]
MMSAGDWVQFGVNILMIGVLVWTAWITFKSQKLQNETAIFEMELEKFKAAPRIEITKASIIHINSPRTSKVDFVYENTGHSVAHITEIRILAWVDKEPSPGTFPTWPAEFLLKPNESQSLTFPLDVYGKAKEFYYLKIAISFYQRFLEKKHYYQTIFHYGVEKEIFDVDFLDDQSISSSYPLLQIKVEEKGPTESPPASIDNIRKAPDVFYGPPPWS